jgi:hypothetical protein
MNSDYFKKLMNEKVVQNLAAPSATAMDNGHCYGKKVGKPLTKSSLKKYILEYLRRHGIPCEDCMKKFTFLSLVEKIRPKEKAYYVDALLAT